MEIIVGASLIAAFVAGMAALFAPCCIAVLLPSYLGNVFREKYKVFSMTFIFFLGIASVFMPIGLGASFLSQFFGEYHGTIFLVGGLFIILVGLALLFGKRFSISMPFRVGVVKNAPSIFLLGVFSAVATMCCAPVLAGVLALSVTSGTIVWGGLYTLAFVLGMTLPLFAIAAFLEKTGFAQRLTGLNKKIGKITVSELVSGLVFVLMGGYITYLAFVDRLYRHSAYQLEVNMYNARFLDFVSGVTSSVPEYIWGLLTVGAVSYISYLFVKRIKIDDND